MADSSSTQPEAYEDNYLSGSFLLSSGLLENQTGTLVSPSQNNSPTANVEGVRPLPDMGPPLVSGGGVFSEGTDYGNKLAKGLSKYPGHILSKAIDALKLPGDVLQGKASPEDIERVFELAGLMVGGSMPISKAIGGVDATLGSFAGVRSRTADKSLLQLAQDAENLGFDPEQIRRSTGWMRGAENRWKYEIDDSQLKYDPKLLKLESTGGSTHLDNVLDHLDLFKAYPELKNVKVEYNPHMNGAEYRSDINTIKIGSDSVDNPRIIMHEVQHALQDIEGFAKGGSPGKANLNYKLKYEDEIDKLRPEFLELQTKDMRGEALTPKEQSKLDYLREIFKTYAKYAHAGDVKAYQNYRYLAGEVESKNVENRLYLSARERIDSSPLATEEVPRSEQIVRNYPSLTTPYTRP